MQFIHFNIFDPFDPHVEIKGPRLSFVFRNSLVGLTWAIKHGADGAHEGEEVIIVDEGLTNKKQVLVVMANQWSNHYLAKRFVEPGNWLSDQHNREPAHYDH